MLFLVDTGAMDNTLSTRAAGSVTKVKSDPWMEVEGVSGRVNKVYRSENVTIRFSRFRQENLNTITLDLSNESSSVGTEVSGILGFELLSNLEIKIDYRDGLIDFIYRDSHGKVH
jgi:hypothetical protein